MCNNPECFEMPTPCAVCGEWFELNEGHASEVHTQNRMSIVICPECGEKEKKVMSLESEIEDVESDLSNWQSEIDEYKESIDYNTEMINKAGYTLFDLKEELKKLQ